MVAPPRHCSSSWGTAWGPRTEAGKAPGSALTGESRGPSLALPAAAGQGPGEELLSPGFNCTKEIPPPGSPLAAQRRGRELPPSRPVRLLAVPADVETRAWLRAGRQWVAGGAGARHTPTMRPTLHSVQSFSKHLRSVCSGPATEPLLCVGCKGQWIR